MTNQFLKLILLGDKLSRQIKNRRKAAEAKHVTERRKAERKQAADTGISYKEFKHNRGKKGKKSGE